MPIESTLPLRNWGSFVSRPDGLALKVVRDGQALLIGPPGDALLSRWALRAQGEALWLEAEDLQAAPPGDTHWLAALEAAFMHHPGHAHVQLGSTLPWPVPLLRSGTIVPRGEGRASVAREALWQTPRLWHALSADPCPLQYTLTQGRRHPRRAPKPSGTVYQRHIPWLDQTLSLRTIDIAQDLPLFHRWMNDPEVSRFWEEEGDLAKHRAYLEAIQADPRVTGLIGCFDGEPFGYFEVYWAKEDRIAPYYDVADFDRGWHALVGEARFRGKPFLTAWMPSISHHLFLDDCRTQRIVIEPRIDNQKMIHSLGRCGYAHLKAFDFPHKRAMLGMLLRERFFNEALWIPQP